MSGGVLTRLGQRASTCFMAAWLVQASSCASAPPSNAATAPSARAHDVRGATHVTFPSRDGDLTGGAPTTLDGWLFRPAGDGPFPAVIALHGCGGPYAQGNKDLSSRHRDWAERLQREGYVVLMPDSFSARGFSEICSVANRTIHPERERARDTYGALEYIQKQPFVRADRVGLLGWSNGAMTVLATVAKDTPARPKALANDFRTAVAFYPGCKATLKETTWSPALPLHLFNGEADDWTEAGPCRDLTSRAQADGAPMDIVLYAGAYHDFDAPDMPLHTKHDVATTASHTATLGTNPAARADAIERVRKIMREALTP